MSRVWGLDPSKKNNPSDVLVLLALADSAGDEGETWPKIEAIEHKSGLGRRTVYRSLDRLEKAGYIERIERRFEDGTQLSNLYKLRRSAFNGRAPVPTTTPTKKTKRVRFEKPDREDVVEHMIERGLDPVEAKKQAGAFLDFYDSNGWRVGKNKMRSWKGASSGWVRRYQERVATEDRNGGTFAERQGRAVLDAYAANEGHFRDS